MQAPSFENQIKEILIGAFGTGIGIGFNYLRQFVEEKRKKRSTEAIEDMASVYDILNELAGQLKTDRLLVLYSSNGGGIPSAGTVISVTILYELVRAFNLVPIRNDFQNLPVDEGYAQLLKNVVIRGEFFGTPKNLQDGFIKELYESEQVDKFLIKEIYRGDKKFFYMSCRWCKGSEIPDKMEIDLRTRIACEKISRILKKSQ
jgi:hypothetical protein